MKKTILFTILIFTFLIIAQNCLAVDLLLDWPSLGGAKSLNELNKSGELGVPSLINYIYKFALGICGITALVSIMIGAAQYTFSAGNSSKAGDAKDRITSALLGILILLFAVLILNTINPDLVNLRLDVQNNDDNNNSTGYYCRGQCSNSGVWGCQAMTGVSSQNDAQQKCYALVLVECKGLTFTAIAGAQSCP